MIRKIVILFALLLPITFSIPVLVNIKESLSGHFSYFNHTFEGEVLEIVAVWENVGSVTCDAYLMVKSFNSSSYDNLGYYWSKKENVPPGKAANFHLFVYVPYYEGSITLIPRLYYCNEIEEYGNITINFYNASNVEELPLNVTYRLCPQKITFYFSQPLNHAIYVIPLKQPPGWIIPSLRLSANITSFDLPYYRPLHSYKTLKFAFTDGTKSKIIEVKFKDVFEEHLPWWAKILRFLGFKGYSYDCD